MTSRRARVLVLSAVLAAPLALAACGGGNEATPTQSAPSSSAAPSSVSPSPSVSVDAEVKEALNVKEGEAIIRGQVESVEQTLSPECTAAVAPLRDAMTKYNSFFEVPEAEKPAIFNEALAEARSTCGESTQEWSNFYNLEFSGWLYAAPAE